MTWPSFEWRIPSLTHSNLVDISSMLPVIQAPILRSQNIPEDALEDARWIDRIQLATGRAAAVKTVIVMLCGLRLFQQLLMLRHGNLVMLYITGLSHHPSFLLLHLTVLTGFPLDLIDRVQLVDLMV